MELLGFSEDDVVIADKLSLSFLAEIVELLDYGKYAQADDVLEKFFIQEQIWDIRCLMYYGFVQLAQYKFVEYIAFAQHMEQLLAQHYELLSPTKRKEKVFQKAIDWFAKHMLDKLEQATTLFPDDESLLETCRNSLSMLKAFSTQGYRLDKPISDTQRILTRYQQAKKVSVPANEEVADEASSTHEPRPEVVDERQQSHENISQTVEVSPSDTFHSVEWTRLQALLKDYDFYMQSGHHEVAYLAHLNIEKALQAFDPVTYFPKLFEPYMRSCLKNHSTLHRLKMEAIEQLPYAALAERVLENHDSAMRKLLVENPFDYGEKEPLNHAEKGEKEEPIANFDEDLF